MWDFPRIVEPGVCVLNGEKLRIEATFTFDSDGSCELTKEIWTLFPAPLYVSAGLEES